MTCRRLRNPLALPSLSVVLKLSFCSCHFDFVTVNSETDWSIQSSCRRQPARSSRICLQVCSGSCDNTRRAQSEARKVTKTAFSEPAMPLLVATPGKHAAERILRNLWVSAPVKTNTTTTWRT